VGKLTYAASVMCANLMRLETDLSSLETAQCDELHFDIMDGFFVPNITLGLDFVRAAKSVCSLPCNAHLMIRDAGRYLDRFVDAGSDSITLHLEAGGHLHRNLMRIREAGVSPGIAINPATPLTKLDYLLDHVDRVLMMTVDPGYAGQKIIPSAFERVRILKENLDHRKLKTRIEVDGNISVTNAAKLANAGATIFVLGTASIFQGGDPGEALSEFRRAVDAKRLCL